MTLKIAIIGAGNVARQSYLPYLSRRQDVLLSYYSRTRAKAEACSKDFGGHVAGSIQELMAEDPDAVLVLTHETQRYEATLPLLEYHPRRVFFEKPLFARYGQANVCEQDFYNAGEMIQKAQAAGAETAMVFNYRFFDQTLRAQQIIQERGFGKLLQASLFVNYACWSHCIDLLHLFGARAAWVTALAGDTQYQGAVDLAGSFRLENGAAGTILGTNASQFDFSLYELHFIFENGSLHFSDLDGPLTVYDNQRRYSEVYTLIGNYSRWAQYDLSFEKSLAAYLESIEQGAPPPIPGSAGLEELQFEAALRRSIAQRRPVEVQSEFPITGPGVK
ncbi:MAG: Gfo/Idh/MocA family oxidoreductase [Anaerolineaceae bacterium]|nr:Gfo/Idh/MocA family oxidoreductase [Anaerolineaceae bacterium]